MASGNIIENGYLRAKVPKETEWLQLEGSLYLTVEKQAKHNLDEKGDWMMLNNCLNGQVLSVLEALNLGKKLHQLFLEDGLKPGNVIHTVIGNENMTFPIAFGIWRLGGVISNGDVNLESRAIANQLKDTDAKIVVCIPRTADLVKKAVELSGKKDCVKVYCIGENTWFENIAPKLEKFDPNGAPEPYVAQDLKKELLIIFWSSGTTGYPKGICHSHFSMANAFGPALRDFSYGENFVTTTCFFHIGGFFSGIFALIKRGTYYHMNGPEFTLKYILEAIKEAKPNHVMLGTHHYIQLSESSLLDEYSEDDLASVEWITPVGAAVPSHCENIYKKKCRNFKSMLNLYGQSESGLITSAESALHLGQVEARVTVKVVDPNTNKPVGPNVIGEICCKSDSLMWGYLNRPKDNAEFFDEEGFGHTGDLVYYTEDGFIYYVDRLKELIKYSGNHVAPTELEDIMQKHPAVKESLFYGRPDPRYQEIISAVVVLKPGLKATEEELTEFVNNQVTDYKKLRGGILFKDSLPRNTVGKLLRREMRVWAQEEADKMKN